MVSARALLGSLLSVTARAEAQPVRSRESETSADCRETSGSRGRGLEVSLEPIPLLLEGAKGRGYASPLIYKEVVKPEL